MEGANPGVESSSGPWKTDGQDRGRPMDGTVAADSRGN